MLRVAPLYRSGLQAQMSAEADAFIGIPGGFGTLEELLEMVTWQQLGLHTKPVITPTKGASKAASWQ